MSQWALSHIIQRTCVPLRLSGASHTPQRILYVCVRLCCVFEYICGFSVYTGIGPIVAVVLGAPPVPDKRFKAHPSRHRTTVRAHTSYKFVRYALDRITSAHARTRYAVAGILNTHPTLQPSLPAEETRLNAPADRRTDVLVWRAVGWMAKPEVGSGAWGSRVWVCVWICLFEYLFVAHGSKRIFFCRGHKRESAQLKYV